MKKTIEDHVTSLALEVSKGFKELNRRMDSKDIEMNEFRQVFANGMKKMDLRVGGLEGQIGGLESKVDSLGSRFEGLEGKVGGLGSKFDGLESKVGGLENKIEKMDARNEIRFQKLEISLTNISLRQFDFEQKLESVHSDVLATKLDVRDIHTRLDGLATTVDRHDTTIETLKKAVGHK